MIHAPSLKPKAVSTLVYSGDPALKLPDDPAEREKALEVARETGQWGNWLHPGAKPTYFHVELPLGTAWNFLSGEIIRHNMTTAEAAAFALRVALTKVENFGDHKVDRFPDGEHEESLASKAIINAIYAEAGEHGSLIVRELGGYIIERGKSPVRPK